MSEGTAAGCIVAGILFFSMIIISAASAVHIHGRERLYNERITYLKACDGNCDRLPN